MTVYEFNKIANSLNKKEYCTFNGVFSYTFENKGIILTVTDGGYTSSLLKDGILYTKDYNNVIRERKVH